MRIIPALITRKANRGTAFAAFCAVWAMSCSVASAAINILPLGDSITWGDGDRSTAGYRTQLLNDCTTHGIAIKFVGPITANSTTALTNAGQNHHCGLRGYRIDQITGNLDGNPTGLPTYDSNQGGYWLTDTPKTPAQVDMIFLHIGTNDVLQSQGADAPARLDALLAKLTALRPNATIFVSSIIPFKYTDPSKPTNTVMPFNAAIPNIVKNYTHAVFVDQFSPFLNANGTVNTSLYADNYHPNAAGYTILADTYFKAYEASVPEPAVGTLLIGAIALMSRRTRHAN